ncbi:hypothetical protein VTI74DRAFT_3128 [Chaetomium olivicolor]
MAQPNYYIGPTGLRYDRFGTPIDLLPRLVGRDMPSGLGGQINDQQTFRPTLRLRPTNNGEKEEEESWRALDGHSDATQGAVSSNPTRRYPDGPWLTHPDEIDEETYQNTKQVRDDITVKENRERHNMHREELLKNGKEDFVQLLCVTTDAPSVDMTAIEGLDPELVELDVERWFVNSHTYLQPGSAASPGMLGSYGKDWAWNARGVYYRHHYSPEWVTGDHSLWVPTLDDTNWNDLGEDPRRIRARRLLKHALDNERWNKSEYAWEADAWSDVFGQMREDPVIAADKRGYDTMRSAVHPVSCVQTGDSKFIWRIPDATFGLATFEPRDYQTAFASYTLDTKRLKALTLHRDCGLIVDPRWGDANLVFPFAVYEAKGWNGDPREARQQACAAAAVYLDLLDALARQPGKSGRMDGAYQTLESRSSQVFAMTSFGAHWHIMVGYRRPRLAREHRGRPGMSDTVYLFQRIWSGRIITEKKAWELLCVIDQIHEWGVTTHRDFVIRHLEPWHEFCEQRYLQDIGSAYQKLLRGSDGAVLNVTLPEWSMHFKDERRAKLQQTAIENIEELRPRVFSMLKKRADDNKSWSCVGDGCGPFPGRLIGSLEELVPHYHDYHKTDSNRENRSQLLENLFLLEVEETSVERAVEHENQVETEQEDALRKLGMPILQLRQGGQKRCGDGEVCSRPSKAARRGESPSPNS